jgi:dihydrofolate reductase
MIAIVVAAGLNGAIGMNNQLLWHLPADLRFFKLVTSGNPILMGRNTFESIGKALPNRRNIVITGNTHYVAPNCEVAHSFEEALNLVKDVDPVMIIGGATIYRQALPYATRIYNTLVDATPEADVFFPDLNPAEWVLQEETMHPADDKNEFSMKFQVYERVEL